MGIRGCDGSFVGFFEFLLGEKWVQKQVKVGMCMYMNMYVHIREYVDLSLDVCMDADEEYGTSRNTHWLLFIFHP